MADLDLRDRKVFIREDLNVPVHDGKVSSDARIRAALPTIQLALDKGARVVLVDDLLATGGTMSAAVTLLEKVGANVVAIGCLIELTFLGGRQRLNVPVHTLLSYDS